MKKDLNLIKKQIVGLPVLYIHMNIQKTADLPVL